MNSLIPRILAFVLCLAGATSAFSTQPESPLLALARELVDTYYGDRYNLTEAAALVKQAYQKNPKDAHVFIQAARITAMGGTLSWGRHEEGMLESYVELLDKAMALDPTNAKAHIFKAQAFDVNGKREQQLVSLDKAKAMGTDDPWLLIGYGNYYRGVGNLPKAFEFFSRLEYLGPGETPSQRRAYIAALWELHTLVPKGQTPDQRLRSFAARAMENRHPRDAYTPLHYAGSFLDNHLYTEAIAHGREALKTMDFGAGRMVLVASLYAQAANQLTKGWPPEHLNVWTDEAHSFGLKKDDVLEYLIKRRGGGSYAPLEASLRKVMR